MRNYGSYFFKNIKYNSSNKFTYFIQNKLSTSFMNYQIMLTYMFIRNSKTLSYCLSRSKCLANTLTKSNDCVITEVCTKSYILELVKAVGITNYQMLINDLLIKGRMSLIRMIVSTSTTPISTCKY